jgi:DNA-binding transcriptional LysR family regulator
VLAVPEDSDLGRRPSPVSLRHLTGVPLITYAQMREVHSIENRLGRPQLRHQIVFRSHDNATILGLAAAGVGAAIISRAYHCCPSALQRSSAPARSRTVSGRHASGLRCRSRGGPAETCGEAGTRPVRK